MIEKSFSFLTIGKTKESSELSEGFKRYVGVGSSYVVAVNPTKKELEEIYGHEVANDPEYIVDTDNGKEARITFIVKTDPESCNGVEMTNRVMFTLRNAPAYNKDQSKVRVIDRFGNYIWMDSSDAKAGKNTVNGNPMFDASSYHIARVGEVDLVDFLRTYLCVKQGLEYVNGTWKVKSDEEYYFFNLEFVKNYFSGDFSEIKEALSLQPNNKIKLLYGVRTSDEGKQYQAVASRAGFFLHNNAGSKAFERLEKDLVAAKESGSYANVEYKVQELQEYVVAPTNLDTPAMEDSSAPEMPWD